MDRGGSATLDRGDRGIVTPGRTSRGRPHIALPPAHRGSICVSPDTSSESLLDSRNILRSGRLRCLAQCPGSVGPAMPRNHRHRPPDRSAVEVQGLEALCRPRGIGFHSCIAPGRNGHTGAVPPASMAKRRRCGPGRANDAHAQVGHSRAGEDGHVVFDRITDIEGTSAENARKLEKAGITTTEHLLAKAHDPKDRGRLAHQADIAEKFLGQWAAMADLMHVKGIGRQYSELLQAVGVDPSQKLLTTDPRELAWTIHEPPAESARCPAAASRGAGRDAVVSRTRRGSGRLDGAAGDGQIALAGGGLMNSPG